MSDTLRGIDMTHLHPTEAALMVACVAEERGLKAVELRVCRWALTNMLYTWRPTREFLVSTGGYEVQTVTGLMRVVSDAKLGDSEAVLRCRDEADAQVEIKVRLST